MGLRIGRKGKKCNWYIDGKSITPKFCPECGKEIYYTSKVCRNCYQQKGILPNKSHSNEYKKLYKRQYKKEHPEYIDKQYKLNKEYRLKNLKKIKAYQKSWRKKNMTKILTNNKNRYLLMKGVKGNHSFNEWENLKRQFNYKCAVCGISEKEIKRKWKNTNFDCLTKDHIIPISKGGSNHINNIRPTCISCNTEKKDKKAFKVVFTCGSWDLLHAGHLNIFQKAKDLGDYLIVGVSTDALISSYKGLKPVICYRDRVAVIKALKCVDKVVKQESLVDIEQFKDLHADIFVLGDDWKNNYSNEGINWLRDNNKIIFLPYTQRLSTSKIKEKIIRNAVQIIKAQSRKK